MMNDLSALENKVAQVAMLCHALRDENSQLRHQLLVAERARDGMAERMEAARERIERLAQQLPEPKKTT